VAARIMVMAGGTGGHVFPALAVANMLREKGCEVTWLGSPNSFESREIPKHGYALEVIDSFRLRGQALIDLLSAPYRLARAVLQAIDILKSLKPDVVLGMGGFASGPGGVAAAILGIPLVIHEQNTIPGMTNRWLSKVAQRVLQAFPNTFQDCNPITCGNPLREEILAIQRGDYVEKSKLSILVLGGSLGAQALNEAVPQAVASLTPMQQPHLVHQVGLNNRLEVSARYASLNVEAEVVEFIDDMAEAYLQADLIICRSGALTVSEVSAVGIPAIFIPFPFAVDDHQTLNAQFLVSAGAARMVRQTSLCAENLTGLIQYFINNQSVLGIMGRKALAHAKPNATACVAEQVLEVAV